MSEEAPRGPAPLEVLDNRDVPAAEAKPIKVRSFEGDKLLAENSLGGPERRGVQFSNALENLPDVEDEPTALAFTPKAGSEEEAEIDALRPEETERRAPACSRKPTPQIEVTFTGAFGEITAPFSSVTRQNGVVALTQAKGQSFRFTPKRTDEGETLAIRLEAGVEITVANPGIAYDRACPCCGAKERCIVLLEIPT